MVCNFTLHLQHNSYNHSMRVLLLIFTFLIMNINICSAYDVQLRDYEEFDIPEGTHISVISAQEFSTAYCEEGDPVSFITTSDIYLYDKNVIPQGSKLTGYIDKKNEPIIGTHASMKVFVNKLYLPDGYTVPMKGYIYTANNNIIGGGLTLPEKYRKVPHYQRWVMFRAYSVTQYVPGETRKMGEHVTISSGANLIVVLTAPLHMTHTVIN